MGEGEWIGTGIQERRAHILSEPKNYQYSIEAQKFHENLAVVVIISGIF